MNGYMNWICKAGKDEMKMKMNFDSHQFCYVY